MKKVLSVIIAISILMCMMGITSLASTTTQVKTAEQNTYKLQCIDADGDGSFTTSDAAEFLKAAAGIVENSDGEQYDIDCDGVVSVVDAQTVLKYVAGIEPILTDAEVLDLFNKKVNSVKSVRPGFEKELTVVCPSIKVTTKNAPLTSLNVTNLEFDQYVKKVVDVMESPFLSGLLDDNMKAQLQDLKTQAVEAYEPQVSQKSVTKFSNAHYSYFPVDNLGWSSKLGMNDISSISYTVTDGKIIYTIKMGTYTYVGDEYPTGTSGFTKRQELPYGKAFNIPSLDESNGSTVNKVTLSNGVITFEQDLKTGDSLSANYAYTYVADVTSPQNDDSDLVMKMVTTTNVTDDYVINRVTVE